MPSLYTTALGVGGDVALSIGQAFRTGAYRSGELLFLFHRSQNYVFVDEMVWKDMFFSTPMYLSLSRASIEPHR